MHRIIVLSLCVFLGGCAQATRVRLTDEGNPSAIVRELLGRHRCPEDAPTVRSARTLKYRDGTFVLVRFNCPENEYLAVDFPDRFETHLYTRSQHAQDARFSAIYRRGDSVFLELNTGAVWEYRWYVNGGRLLDSRGTDVPFEQLSLRR